VFTKYLDRGVGLQLNLLSLSGYYGSKEKEVAEKMLQEGMYSFIGTDLHHERHLKRLSFMQLDQKIVKRLEQTNWQNITI
jgi:tyrosine-protein phosphatase YwqE